MPKLHETAVTNEVVVTQSGNARTPAQLATAVGTTGNLARQAAEAAVRAGTLVRIEGGGLPLRYAAPGKGV